MNKIECYSNWWCYSNWCWIDRLDGVDLKDGELLFVRFPDGHAQGIECIVEKKTIPISEQGGQYNVHSSRAFAAVDYHGQTIRIPLVGLEARRV